MSEAEALVKPFRDRHLTVAQAADARALDEIAARFTRASAQRLPITSSVNEAMLIDNRSGRWETGAVFPLGAE
ncbi:MAG: hypothetical protein JO128_11355 [Alphaproteobacteria bacterium]|nr:hypothetical protein [Alphaproteobacteria bacterium]